MSDKWFRVGEYHESYQGTDTNHRSLSISASSIEDAKNKAIEYGLEEWGMYAYEMKRRCRCGGHIFFRRVCFSDVPICDNCGSSSDIIA